MLRIAVSLIALLSLLTPAVAQTPPATTAPVAQSAPQAKPVAKKAAPKAKPTAKPPVAAESGPCRLGVISVIGDRYSVQKFGITIFEAEASEVPIDWGLDDLVVARVRAATNNDPGVRRIAYPKGVFEPFYNPKTILIRDPGERLPDIVRSFTANANCERYLVATTFKAELPNSHMTLNGIGTYNQGVGGILRHSHLFANVAITLIDGRSYEEIKRPFVNFGANFAASLRLTEDPLNKLDNSLFPDPPAAASASAALRERTRALITDRLDRGLPGYLKEE
ncbi:hypothetical protein ACVIWV_007966 [Bradyrhizobium diazoefficiens]|uniref:Uncharacterized protein n=1 Tax=Bradyrhizobium diazoefficiens TaxID=1355477 RepID=A0A0E4FT44_9BRAD|nr:hypothetical protein [Bradyrhizobium diazoefficiens]MBR0860606.1 hypothetical protein [Bradyrhizobium diazoefficiens]MBR0885097.1 hypothetical protein [Bradyrhizobium diazoefficiens]MBR0917001.1 hypothetical protein [Bradyrhizobium diazoefficiens]BAR56841.1 hypothetical protein NK6_3665 [Bradyrhizobium diazoefficiens]